MSTIEDFENAPIGATATHDKGTQAMKGIDVERSWVTSRGGHLSNGEMAYWGYTLDQPVPTTAREALAFAWELAHPVEEGQTIPAGTEFIEFGDGTIEGPLVMDYDWMPYFPLTVRTLDPLPEPEPEPDWLDAPAVLATHKESHHYLNPTVWTKAPSDSDRWITGFISAHWRDLRDVTPLYPKEQDA